MNHRIIIGDCREALKSIPANSVHLVVTSPPYNVGIDYEKWHDYMSLDEYLKFTKEWLSECYRVLTDDGRICVNVPTASYKGNGIDLFHFHAAMKETGFTERELIIWAKRRYSDGEFISKRKIYGTWNPANPMLRNPIEAIIVMNKHYRTLNCNRESDLTPREFLKWNYTLWEMDTETDRSHPAPYPVELPKRLIKFYSFPEQTILDPFLGSGTTMKACLELNRNSIGIELNPEYVEMARRRLGYCNVSVENVETERFIASDNCVVIDGIRYTLPNRIL